MKSVKRSVSAILLTFTTISVVYASASYTSRLGSLSGTITNHETGVPLPDANVFIEGSRYGAASRDGGYYIINNLPFGTYTIRVQVIGYRPSIHNNVVIDGAASMDMALLPVPIPMNPIIKTASRSDHLQNHISESSEVYSQIHFRECNGNTAGEIVENSSGMYVKDYGGFAGIKSLSIRGSESSQVLVLLDGMRLNSSRDGGVDINSIPIEALERIEIIRGGHSSLLGTDAVGGAINLITHESIDSRGFSYQLRSTAGSFGTLGWNIQGAWKLSTADLFINYNRMKSDGNYKYIDNITHEKTIRDNNDLTQNSLFTKLKLKPFRNATLGVTYQQLNSERGVPGSTAFPSPKARREEDRYLVGMQYEQQLTHQFRFDTKVYYQKHDNHYQDPAGWVPIDSHHEGKTTGGDILTHWSIDPKFYFQLGAEYRCDKLESTDIGKPDRTILSFFVRSEWDPSMILSAITNQLTIIPAFRFDKYSDIASQVSPKLGFVFKKSPQSNMTLKGNIGTAFRAPTFNDLYWPEDFFSKGNPDLKPETSFNVDVGLVYQNLLSNLFQWESTLFYNRVKDLIQWQPDSDFKWMPTNVGTAVMRGIENSCTFRTAENQFYFKASHTWMRAENKTANSPFKGNRLIFRPETKYDLQAGLNTHQFYFNLNYRYVDQQFRTNENSNTCPVYHLLNGNIGFTYPLKDIQLDIKLQTYNIFNKKIEVFEGYPLPGREFRISAGIKY